MTDRLRLWLLVLVTYALGRFVCEALFFGGWRLGDEFLIQLVLVPVAQIAALELVRLLIWRRAW